MNSELMLLPLLGQVILTFCVGFLARIRREKSVKEGFNWRYFKTFEGEKPPRYVLQADQHLVNLFEVPMLFFAAGILAISLDTVDTVILLFASIYVISRVIHAIISLTNNRLLWRGRVFVFSTIIILMMWFWLIYLNF
jgi:hypothetical protein